MTITAKLEPKITALIEREGGSKFTNHPADKGGPTRWGVTEQVARAYGYTGDMQQLPESIARQIYRERFWFAPNFHRVDALTPIVADEMFDTGVNMNPSIPARFLQRALNTLNSEAKHYPDIGVDGVIGNMTIHALSEFLKRRGQAGATVLARMLDSQQSVRYMEISEANKSQEVFQYGWQANRIGIHQ